MPAACSCPCHFLSESHKQTCDEFLLSSCHTGHSIHEAHPPPPCRSTCTDYTDAAPWGARPRSLELLCATVCTVGAVQLATWLLYIEHLSASMAPHLPCKAYYCYAQPWHQMAQWQSHDALQASATLQKGYKGSLASHPTHTTGVQNHLAETKGPAGPTFWKPCWC